jgi:hypothetical protein
VHVERHRDTDYHEAQQLHRVADPPAELLVVEEQLRDQRDAEPHQPDDDDQVGAPTGERVGPYGPCRDRGEEAQTDDQHHDRGRAGGLRHGGNRFGEEDAHDPEPHNGKDQHRLEHQQRPHGGRPAQRGQSGEGEYDAAGREHRGTREGDDAILAGQHAGGRETVDGEDSRHDGEGRAEQDGAAVATAGAHDRQDQCGGCRDQRGEGQYPEVDPAVHVDLLPPEEMQHGKRQRGARPDENRKRHKAASEQTLHGPRIGLLSG